MTSINPIRTTAFGGEKRSDVPDRRSAMRSVMDKAMASPHSPNNMGHTNAFSVNTFRRDERDRRPCRPVPMPGDPPADLSARRAAAEAGNPGVKPPRGHNLENVRKNR